MFEYVERKLETAPNGNEFVLSDGEPDRMGDVIEPEGWQIDQFDPVALFNHSRADVIGKWERVRVEDRKLKGALKLATKGTSPVVDMARALFEQGLLDTVSVGFRPIEAEPLDPKDRLGPQRYRKAELVEASLVSVPANPRARRIAKQFLPEADYRRLCASSGVSDVSATTPGVSAKAKHIVMKGQTTMEGTQSLPIGKRIELTEQALVQLRDRMGDVAASFGDEPNEEQRIEIEDLSARIEKAENLLGTYRTVEEKQKALVVSKPAAERKVLEGEIILPSEWTKKENRPFDLLTKALAADFIAKRFYRDTGKVWPIQSVIAEKCKGDNERFIQTIADRWVTKAAVNPAATNVSGWAQELVATVNADFIDVLSRVSIYAALARLGQRFSFGRNGLIKIPMRSATPTIQGSFVGEGQPIPVRRAGLTSTTLGPKKMAVISSFTRELDLHSIPSIQQIIRDAIINDTANALDSIIIDALASTAVRPAGLRAAENTPTNVTASAATAAYDKMVADFKALISAIVTAGGDASRIAFIMNPAQALSLSWVTLADGSFPFGTVQNGSQIRGNQVIVSANMTAGMIIAVDTSMFASVSDDNPEFDLNDNATLHEEDTTPLPISAVGTPNTVAAPARSLWQTYSAAIRMILPMNWVMVRPAMVAYITSVGW